jgi:phage terminase large subunit-like protein
MTTTPSRDELIVIEKQLREIERRKKECAIDFYTPYPKQQEFHDAGMSLRERLLMAGNQNGKTFCGGAEVSYHLTGLYPEWWLGRRWERPTRGWVAGVTGESTRDNPQRILLGTVANGIGTGLIPKKCLDREKMTLARGVSDLYDTVLVKHFGPDSKEDGWSEMKFKSYERGRTKWQGDTLDWLWYDEEPPLDIYTEGLARITATGGMVFITFTPLEGMSNVVTRFIDEKSQDRGVVTMTIDDALHIPAEDRAKIVAGFPEHEREARARGVPMLGSGKVFQISEASITVEDFVVPRVWALIWGLDFGLDHPFGATLLAWDRDTDTIYVTKCVRMRGSMPLQHAQAMKPCANGNGWKVPAAWPQDGWQRKEFDGDLKPLALIYKRHGLHMLPDHAKFIDGSNSTEAGIMEMQERMLSNRFKVFASCTEWFDEYRRYHRKDGQLVKLNDDLLSATRVGVVDRRHAKAVNFYQNNPDGSTKVAMAKDVDIDPFGN